MTALPLFWAEGNALDLIAKSGGKAPVLSALETRFKVAALDILDKESLKGRRLIMLAQPAALRPEELVLLDQWVRAGGRLIVFADTNLRWESQFGLGDPRRPPVRSLLGPLFKHWGLALSADKWTISNTNCRRESAGLVVRCHIGSGVALLVADADLLNQSSDKGRESRNHDSVFSWLDSLESSP